MKRTFAGYLNQAAYNLLPEDIYMFILFRAKCGYFWNMKDPKTFREKMYLLLRYYKHNPQLAQIVSDKYTVEEYVAKKIADAIRYLLDNPEEARRMGENGRRAIKEEFNWETQEKKLIELYQYLMG